MTQTASPLYVAVVEDDPPVRRALDRLLTDVGFDVRTFGSAEEFIETLPASAPSCVVLDVHLPGMGGLALHGHLEREGHQAGVVFITADHEVAGSAEIRHTGAPCLLKPLDEDVLIEAINQLLHARSSS